MEPEERSALQIKTISDKIWESFLLFPDQRTEYELQEPEEENFIPSKAKQLGIIRKIEKNWHAISNVKQNGYVLTFDIHRNEFNKFRRAFKNPKIALQSYRISKIVPVELPKGIKWEHITIKFLDRHNIEIRLRSDKDFREVANFKDLGLQNDKTLTPNMQWLFLELLASKEGRITWEDSEASPTRRKQKELLSKALKIYFQINEDPFRLYKKEKAYELKFTAR